MSRCLNSDAGNEAKTVREGPAFSADLYMHPEKWKGLPPQRILELYWERMARLGSEYKPNKRRTECLINNF